MITAVVVTWLLAGRGLPTSLTLAVVGAIAGAGVGARLPVSWGTVATVLVLGALAPIAGLGLAFAVTRVAAAWSSDRPLDQRTQRWHVAAFGLQCLAYGSNDGQKMLAVLAVATGTVADGRVPASPLAVGGRRGGVPDRGGHRVCRGSRATLGGGVVAVRPHEAVASEFAAATVVLGHRGRSARPCR